MVGAPPDGGDGHGGGRGVGRGHLGGRDGQRGVVGLVRAVIYGGGRRDLSGKLCERVRGGKEW